MSNVIEVLRKMNVPTNKENVKNNWPLTQKDVKEKLRAEEFIARFKMMNRDSERYFSYQVNCGRRVATTQISVVADVSADDAFSDYAIAYIESSILDVMLADNPKLGKNACVSVMWICNPAETLESINVKIALAC